MQANVFSLTERKAQRISAGQPDAIATFSQAWEVYITTHRYRELKPKSRRGYTSAFRKWGPLLDARAPLGVDEIGHWLIDITEHEYRGRPIKRAQANYCLRVLKAVVNEAAVKGEMAGGGPLWRLERIVNQVKPLRTGRRVKRNPAKDVVVRCLKVCRNKAERIFVKLLAASGMRIEEILGLQPQDFNPLTRTIIVSRTYGSGDRKNYDEHKVMLTHQPDLVEGLKWVIKNHAHIVPRQGRRKGAPLPREIFPWRKTYRENFMERLRAGLREQGVDPDHYFPPGLAFHAFRHWGANEVLERTGDIVAVANFLGDRTLETAGTYCEPMRGSSHAEALPDDALMCHKVGEKHFDTPPL